MLCNVWIRGEEKSCCDLTAITQGDSGPHKNSTYSIFNQWETVTLCFLLFAKKNSLYLQKKTVAYTHNTQKHTTPL